jgi:hypothetical protein
MSPYFLIAVFVAILVAGAGGFKLGADHEVAARAREDQHTAEAVEAANSAWAKSVSELRPKYTTIQGKLEKQIETNTVYRDCKLDAVGVQLVNQALSAGTPTTPSSGVPSSNGTPK